MEEKIYFKPENSNKTNSHRIRNLIIFLLALVVMIVIIVFLIRGETTTSGEYPSPIETNSLSCKKDGTYPKITSATSGDSTISIAAVFDGATSLKSLSLNYDLIYETEVEIDAAEAKAHFEFGEGLAKQGLNFTEFSNKFSKLKDRLAVSLYGGQSDFSDATRASYFMVNISEQGIPKTLNDYKVVYETQGFKCVSSDEN